MVIGRAPEADIRLDAAEDLAVSGTHAELRKVGDRWAIRDLESRNGTFVNGERIHDPVVLAHGDVLRFGSGGPEATFSTFGSVTDEVKARTARHTRTLRHVAIGLALVAALAGGVAWLAQRDRAVWEAERSQLHATVDSLLEQEERASELAHQLEALDQELARSRAEIESIQARMGESREVGAEETAALREELDAATRALARQQMAANLDFEGIEDRNRSALVLVFAEREDGRVVTGSGFVVRDDATVVTAGHLFRDDDGRPSVRQVAVQFADSRQVWASRLLEVSQSADLALVRAEGIQGAVPTIYEVNARSDTLATGSPVAAMGFPLGGGLTPAEARGAQRALARPLISAGVIRDNGPTEMRIQGFGQSGASGSPVFDADGRVVAVIYGGDQQTPGGVLGAVPSQAVMELLERAGVR